MVMVLVMATVPVEAVLFFPVVFAGTRKAFHVCGARTSIYV